MLGGVNSVKKNYKKGMILAEVLFTIVLCGILIGISIFLFKSKDVTKTPYIFSVLKKLPEVNSLIADECFSKGNCDTEGVLPDDLFQYCMMLSDSFISSGEINCTPSGSPNSVITIGSETYGMNFKLSNGVAFYGLNPEQWDDSLSNNFIDVFIDIDGAKKGENALQEDIFPLRIFKNGEVVPSYTDDFKAYEDEEFFAYRIILNRAANPDNPISRRKEIVDAKTSLKNLSLADFDKISFKEKVSFKEGICASNPQSIEKYFADENCNEYQRLDICAPEGTNDDPSAFCELEPVKPRGSGIFKIFGI